MKYFVLLIVLFLSYTAYSQVDTVKIETFTIMEKRLPIKLSESGRSVEVITAEDIQKSNAVSINEVLTTVAGLDIRQRGPLGVQADIGIRGGSFDQTLVLINGMKLSDPQTGHHALNLPILMENIERIEVIKGPAARLYGSNAFAGAINIVTKTANESFLYVSAVGGEKNLYQTTLGVNWAAKSNQHSLYLNMSGSDSFYYNTDFKMKNLSYQADTKLKGWKVSFLTGINTRKFGANSFYSSKSYMDQYEETSTYFAGLHTNKKLTDKFSLGVKIYARHHEDNYILFRQDPSIYQNIHTSNQWSFEATGRRKIGKGTLSFGLDTRIEELESTNLGGRSRTVSSGFADLKMSVGKIMINPGFNLSFISGYDPQLFPGVDISLPLTKNIRLFTNVGTSYRVPTYTDLYYVGPSNIGNNELTPEKAWNTELGVKRNSDKANHSVAIYYKKASNAIEWVKLKAGTDDKWQPQNLLELETKGLEWRSDFYLNKIFKKQSFLQTLNLSYNFLLMTSTIESSLESAYQLNGLRHQLIAKLSHKIVGKVQHQLTWRFIDRMAFDRTHGVVDSRIFWEKKSWKIFAEATNVFDTNYSETGLVLMPGRWIRVGGSLKVGLKK